MRRDLTLSERKYLYTRLQEEPDRVVNKVFSKNYHEVRTFDKILYWGILILAIIGNFIVSIVLVPLLTVLSSGSLLLVIAIIAITFGFLFSSLLRDIESLNPNSYVMGSIFLPIQALINVYFITLLANEVSTTLKIENWHNPLIIGIVYMCAFISPYIFSKILKMRYLPVPQ
jgi:hypothetical protein